MRTKFISVFLLLLFSMVIMFPGYSKSKPMDKRAYSIGIKETKTTSLQLLLKCLSLGLNGVDEENAPEEDEDASVENVCYLKAELQSLNLFQSSFYLSFITPQPTFNYSASVPVPPPDFKS